MAITSTKMQFVIDKLESVLPICKKAEQLDMSETRVRTPEHECGTIHCFGGWYAVANKERPKIQRSLQDEDCLYIEGADLMAQHLGFRVSTDLALWARKNPAIWGNKLGSLVFCGERAFGRYGKSLKGIIRHLKMVQKRLEKLELSNKNA